VHFPYNVPDGIIEFPVEQDYFMSPASFFSLTSEEKSDFNRHSGSFLPFFQKISHEIEILLSVISFGAVHIYLDIRDFRLYYSKARSPNIQPFYRRYERQDKLFYFPLFKRLLEVRVAKDFLALPPDVVLRFCNRDLKQIIFPEINQSFPIPEPQRLEPQQFSLSIDAYHSYGMSFPILFAFLRGGSDKDGYFFFFALQSENLACIEQV